MQSLYIGFSAAMGLLFSPDHLRLWGNLAGSLGPLFWLATMCAALLYCLTALGYNQLTVSAVDGENYVSALHRWGGKSTIALLLGSRLVLLMGMSAGILVSAGFVFNETFAYWFPTFAFAFALLAVVAVTHFFGYRAAGQVQFGLLAITLAGLAFLVGAGFLRPGPNPLTAAGHATGSVPTLFSGALLLFVGCDLAVHRIDYKPADRNGPLTMLVAIGITAVVLSLWATVSLMHVSTDRLAESFIPFTLAARQISGQTGRLVMGMVVVAGTGCAVITLFSAASHLIAALADQRLLPRFLTGSRRKNIPGTLLWTAVIAALMAFGFAGSPSLEVFIRAGFILWLLQLILIQLMAASRKTQRAASAVNEPWYRHYTWTNLPSALLLTAGTGCLWIMDAQRVLLSAYVAAAWAGSLLLLLISHWSQHLKKVEEQRNQ